MENPPERSHCTDITWQGRADCQPCNVRHLMMFSGLPEHAFTEVLRPIDTICFPRATVLFEEGQRDKGVFSIRSGMIMLLSLTTDGTLGNGPAPRHVAWLLLMVEYGHDLNQDIELLGREHMAAINGTSVETASRIIAELKRCDILHKTGPHHYRCGVAALEAITREDS